MIHTTFAPKEEQAALEETARQTEAAFKEELRALLLKYKCEMSIATSSRGYETCIDGIEISFDGIYEGGKTIRPYFDINIGNSATGDCV